MSERDIRPSAVYHELVDALGRGCPICSVVNQRIRRWIDTLLYEHVNDAAIREQLRRSLGFCNRHAWLVRAAGDVLGQAIIYADILTAVAKSFDAGDRPVPGADCALCVEERAVERLGIDEFLKHFRDAELQARYRESAGLCLPHLAAALEENGDSTVRLELVRVERLKVADLIHDLAELKRRQDWRHSSEPPGREHDAWDRAIEKLCGQPGVKATCRDEGWGRKPD